MREALIRQCIQQRSVFYTNSLNQDSTSNEPHNFVVLNSDPLGQGVVILVMCTTQHTKVRKRVVRNGFSSDTIVFISTSETQILKKDTSVDCNEFQDLDLDDFMNTVIKRKLRYRGTIESLILNKLVESIQLSTMLPKKYESFFSS